MCQSNPKRYVLGAACIKAMLLICIGLSAHAQEAFELADAYFEPHATIQTGIDAWQISTQSKIQTTPGEVAAPLAPVDDLYFANSYTQWNYQPISPWVKIMGSWNLTNNFSLEYKIRSEASVGDKVDDLHVNWRLSPQLGFKAGVVDYKTSWCRTYDTASPWVRENNPFCTTQTTNIATAAAPGVQAYWVARSDQYEFQSIVGVYRPMAFGYNATEFSNYPTINGVASNDRWGWSLSAVNLENATEFRLSWLGADQYSNINDDSTQDHNRSQLLFAGVGFYPTAQINIKLYALRNTVIRQSLELDSDGVYLDDTTTRVRSSATLEINDQLDGRNSLNWAISKYSDQSTQNSPSSYDYAYIYNEQPLINQWAQENMSLAWRHEWGSGIFTSVQWTRSIYSEVMYTFDSNYVWYPTYGSAQGTAIGFRLGFTY